MQGLRKNIGFIISAIILILALAVGIGVVIERNAIENANDTVAITMDWADITTIASNLNIETSEVLETLESAGVLNGIIYKEPVVSELETNRQVRSIDGDVLAEDIALGNYVVADVFDLVDTYNYYIVYDYDVANRLFEHFSNKSNADVTLGSFEPIAEGYDEYYVVGTSLTSTALATFGIGFDLDVIEMVESYGLSLTLQIRSFSEITVEAVDTAFEYCNRDSVIAIAFNDSALPAVSLTTAEWTSMLNLLTQKFIEIEKPLALIEFYTQSGLTSLAAALDFETIRLHSISASEVASLDVDSVGYRFALATSERNMNICLLRVPTGSLESIVEYLSVVVEDIEAKGLTLSAYPTDLDTMETSTLSTIIIALAIAVGGMLLCLVLGLGRLSYLAAALGLIGTIGLIAIGQLDLARRGLALVAAIVFPTFSVYMVVSKKGTTLLGSIVKLIGMTLISMYGGLMIIALLSQSQYMVSIQSFNGVKIAQFVPIAIILVVYWLQGREGRGVIPYALDTMKIQISVGMAAIAVVGAVVLAFLWMRSGNDSTTVFSFESVMRATLDEYLYVRPRTKEFLFAHPLMLVVLYFGYNKKTFFLPAVAMIGQVSVVNTFCHIHTPLAASLLRTFNGLLLGTIIGIILILVIKLLLGVIKNGQTSLKEKV